MDFKTNEDQKLVRLFARAETGTETGADGDGASNLSSDFPLIANYQVLEKIGTGSLTDVYKVKRQGIETIFAAKVLRADMAANARTAKRFKQESDKAVGLNDPHLLSVYESLYTEDGRPALICDFVQGESLADRLADDQPMSEGDVLNLLEQLLPALSLAHKNKTIHRDLKPSNIVFHTGQGVEIVKLTDFGIAKVLPSVGSETRYITPEGEAFGNPTYMSPEQLQGAKLDARSDIYSLGCVVYQCLAGRPPFKSSNAIRLALKQMQDDPAPIAVCGPIVSDSLESVVMRMLRKNPDDRYQSVDELLKDIKVVQKGGKVKMPPLKAVPKPVEAPQPKSKPAPPAPAVKEKERAGFVFNPGLASSALEGQSSSKKGGKLAVKAQSAEQSLLKDQPDANVSDIMREKARKRRREEYIFAGSIFFFVISLVVAVPAICSLFSWSGKLTGMQYDFEHMFKRDEQIEPVPVYKGLEKTLYNRNGDPIANYYREDLLGLLSTLARDEHLRGVRLEFLTLRGIYLISADMSDSVMVDVDFSNADLHGTSFRNADLRGVQFSNANLDGCDFRGAHIRGCTTDGASMVGTNCGDNAALLVPKPGDPLIKRYEVP